MVLFDVEDMVTILACQLGLIHGLIGLTQQLIRVHLLRLRVEGDADTRRDLHGEIAEGDRCGSGGKQAVE